MRGLLFSTLFPYTTLFRSGVLFHEVVHAEQYRQLGLGRFAELYVRGFLSGGGYDGIPLEVNAYTLGTRFEDGRRSEEHTSELQSRRELVCRLLLEKKNFAKGEPARRNRIRGLARVAAGLSAKRCRW